MRVGPSCLILCVLSLDLLTACQNQQGFLGALNISQNVSSPSASSTGEGSATAPAATPVPTATPTTPQVAGPVPIPNGTWIMIPTHGYPAQAVGWEKLVYSPDTHRSIMLGNYHEFGSEPNEGMVSYDFVTNRWDVLDVGGTRHNENMPDGGHPTGTFVYDPNQKVYVYYCCNSGSMEPEDPYHTWWFDPVGQVGRDKLTLPRPGMIMEGTGAFDIFNNLFVYFNENGILTYDTIQNQWTTQDVFGAAMPTRALASMAFDSNNHKSYLFGGRTGYGTSDVFYNDLYSFDSSTNILTLINPVDGVKPPARQKAGFAYDAQDDIFLLYGGNNDSGLGESSPLGDTWVYSPSTNQWTQLYPSNSPLLSDSGVFERLTYDSANNVFLMVVQANGGYADGNWNSYSIQTWAFRYSGTGPDAGAVVSNPQPSAGSININSNGWASTPVLASNNSNLFAGWIEIGQPYDSSNAAWPHVYASQFSSGIWTNLGGAYNSINSEYGGYSESHDPSLAVINGTPWIAWYDSNNSAGACGFCVKSWNGTTWNGGSVGQGSTTASPGVVFDGQSSLIGISGMPTVAFLETDKSYYPQKTFVYVKSYNGSRWNLVGSGPLNIYASDTINYTVADSVSLTSDGTNPIVAWTEYTTTGYTGGSNPQVYVARWNGTQWTQLGGSLNMNSSGWAFNVAITYMAGQPYVAWTERSEGGNTQVVVKTYNNGAWVSISGSSLNRDLVTGWAFHPAIVPDPANNALYLGWVEQSNIGEKAQVFISKFSGGVWSNLGGSLNVDSNLGSAQRVALSVLNGTLVAAWGEVSYGSMRQIFVKQWSGTNWALMSR